MTRPRARWLSWATRLLGLAAAYYVTGKLALLLAIPPGYATAIWPPAGLALGGLLVFGLGAWPAVFLGSFAVNVGTSFDPSTTASLVRSLSLTSAIAAGAALQALAGAHLVRRLLGYPLLLDNERDVGRFFILGAGSCMINATAGVTTLLLNGAIAPDAYPFSWWTWWVGDTLGMITVAPLVLAWAGEPPAAWRSRRWAISWPLAVVAGLLITLFLRVSGWEQRRVQGEFERQASRMANAVERRIAADLEILELLKDLFASSHVVDRAEFVRFTRGSLERHPGILALSWSVPVADTARAAFEAMVAREGASGFRLTERGPDGRLVAARPRPEHLVIRYIEPMRGNAGALGFDITSDPVRRNALAMARDSGRPVALPGVRLVQDTAGESGLLVFRPVYAAGASLATADERRAHLRGYVTAVMRVDDLVEAALRGVDTDGIELRLSVDRADASGEQLLYRRDGSGAAGRAGAATLLTARAQFEFGAHRWTVHLQATSAYTTARRSWEAWVVLAAGLLVAGLLGAFLLVMTGRASRTQALIDQRTRELVEANGTLTRLAAIVEAAPEAIVGTTLAGDIVSWNPGAERMYGFRLEDVLGRPISMLHPSDGRARDFGLLDQISDGTHVLNLETVNLTSRGALVDVSLTISPIRDANGVVVGAATIARNVTDRKRVERALQAEREFLTAVLENLKDGIVACDARGVLTVFNRATREFHSLPADPIPAEQWARHYDLFRADGVTPMQMEEVPLFRALRGEQVNDAEFVIAPRHSPPRTLLASGRAIASPGGEPLGAVVAMHDVTERKALERAKDEFVATVSHELRTPLTAIRGFLEMLADGDAGPVTATQREFLHIAARNTDRLASLVNDLLDVNRIQSEALEVASGPVDLTRALTEVATTFRHTAEAKGLAFRAEIAPALYVLGDASRLIQAFANLVSNAVKYTPRGAVVLHADLTARGIEVTVRDTGVGIPPGELEKLFTKFFRGGGRVVTDAGGTGLGLVIVKAIVERHAGSIQVESRPDDGACFRVFLPALLSRPTTTAAA